MDEPDDLLTALSGRTYHVTSAYEMTMTPKIAKALLMHPMLGQSAAAQRTTELMLRTNAFDTTNQLDPLVFDTTSDTIDNAYVIMAFTNVGTRTNVKAVDGTPVTTTAKDGQVTETSHRTSDTGVDDPWALDLIHRVKVRLDEERERQKPEPSRNAQAQTKKPQDSPNALAFRAMILDEGYVDRLGLHMKTQRQLRADTTRATNLLVRHQSLFECVTQNTSKPIPVEEELENARTFLDDNIELVSFAYRYSRQLLKSGMFKTDTLTETDAFFAMVIVAHVLRAPIDELATVCERIKNAAVEGTATPLYRKLNRYARRIAKDSYTDPIPGIPGGKRSAKRRKHMRIVSELVELIHSEHDYERTIPEVMGIQDRQDTTLQVIDAIDIWNARALEKRATPDDKETPAPRSVPKGYAEGQIIKRAKNGDHYRIIAIDTDNDQVLLKALAAEPYDEDKVISISDLPSFKPLDDYAIVYRYTHKDLVDAYVSVDKRNLKCEVLRRSKIRSTKVCQRVNEQRQGELQKKKDMAKLNAVGAVNQRNNTFITNTSIKLPNFQDARYFVDSESHAPHCRQTQVWPLD